MHCGGIAFAQKRYWIYVEIMGFFINIIQLMFFLCFQMDAASGCKGICAAFGKYFYECCCKSK
jgi:hypothetical protein